MTRSLDIGVLRRLFGPSKDEIWGQLAERIGASYDAGGFFKTAKVEARVAEWTVTLDTYTVSSGNSSTTYTRLRAPYVNADGFRFTIYRKSLFTGLGKLFGMQDVEIGHPEFDEEFVIKGTHPARLRVLLQNAHLRQLIQDQPRLHLGVKDDEGWFGSDFPDGVDELYFQAAGVIKDLDILEGLFDLFSEMLHALCDMGSAYEDDPGVELK